MLSLNEVFIGGYLGRDPELRHTPSGTAVANFTVATTRRWTDSNGEKQEDTQWHRVVLWKNQAELASKMLRKGDPVIVRGALQTREWEDQNGNKKQTTEIRGMNFQAVKPKGDRADAGRQEEKEEEAPF